jgi:hypothetical protein
LSPLRRKRLPRTSQQSREGTALELVACCQCRERHILCLQKKQNNEPCVMGTNTKGFYSDTGKNRLSRLEKKR